ncbi:hypothetical protein P4679_26560 [Priestia megaterium]|uniref:hypothetical protein n=1 Tax=Priestia megaterium TaxID=1404 RepID=UPI002E1C4753|nr:hypothetical protein [Priestia megaterium]
MEKISLAVMLALGLFVSTSQAEADVSVKGYYRKDGTYVRPHMRSDPDGNFENNWSTKGNINPYTGEEGTRTSPSDSGSYDSYYDSSDESYYNSEDSYSNDDTYYEDSDYTDSDSSVQAYDESGYVDSTDFIDNEDAMYAMDTVYKYFDKLNEKEYKDAYNLWNKSWKKKHSYKKFKKGYKGVKHDVNTISVDSSEDNKVTIVGIVSTKENDEEHSYDFIYKIKVDDNGKGKITKGKLQKNY